jgi:hypothetical protein
MSSNTDIARGWLMSTADRCLYISDPYMRTELTMDRVEYFNSELETFSSQHVASNRVRRLISGILYDRDYICYFYDDALVDFLADYIPVAIVSIVIDGKLENLTFGIQDDYQREMIDTMRCSLRRLDTIRLIRGLFRDVRVVKG